MQQSPSTESLLPCRLSTDCFCGTSFLSVLSLTESHENDSQLGLSFEKHRTLHHVFKPPLQIPRPISQMGEREVQRVDSADGSERKQTWALPEHLWALLPAIPEPSVAQEDASFGKVPGESARPRRTAAYSY